MIPYDIVAGPNDDVRVKAGGEELAHVGGALGNREQAGAVVDQLLEAR